jgi:hypothetical protein
MYRCICNHEHSVSFVPDLIAKRDQKEGPVSDNHEGKLNKLTDKAQDSLAHFFDDPEKVEKAQEKAEGLLAKHMDEKSAEQAVDKLTDVLRGFSRGRDSEDAR